MSKFTATDIINETCLKLMYHNRNETRSNLPFQIALYINAWLFPLWLLSIIINLNAKYDSLTNVYRLIIVAVFLILSISGSLKLYLGYIGNLAGKIPELASCWLISILIQLPLVMFLLLDHGLLSHSSETFINSVMVCLLLVEVITGTIALTNLANCRAKTFYLMHVYN
ncbi:Transmembrane protein 17B [Habropoda laboriosa]|uniref:Transmembrane protein 17B n=1 Tax=Habropoda laboriosa TaxID=597456 RepID=A0A0L7R6W0_9HYME|nr:PREDICTED: transmembrane protein 17-like [Habropoda laboriosa]KOC66610.1 Transmembrane protein 17B [Habropoda laboriosa]